MKNGEEVHEAGRSKGSSSQHRIVSSSTIALLLLDDTS